MACGMCSSTGVFQLPSPTFEVNPLGGQPLGAGQILVRGPSNTVCVQPDGTIGPRVTVVNPGLPSTWPKWIVLVNGSPTDPGTIPGGCWQGQELPSITVVAKRAPKWAWWLLLVVGVVLIIAERRR